MSTQKHTDGPWHYAPGELVYGPLGETVASCRFVTNFKDTNVANMRLIAAAPDLLSVALALVEFADGNNRINLTGKLAEAVGLARAALAKAEGVK